MPRFAERAARPVGRLEPGNAAGSRQHGSTIFEFAGDALVARGRGPPSACKLDDQGSCSGGNAGHGVRIDRMRPAVLRQMEEGIAADQSDVTSAGAVDVTGFAGRHEGLGSDYVRGSAGASQFSLGQLAQLVARRLQREFAADGADVCAEMYPGSAPFGNRTFPPRSARHEIVETEMAELMTAVCSEDHVAAGRGRNQRAQRFEPADEATAPLGG